MILPGETLPLNDPLEISERLGRQVDLVVDGGACGFEPTTVIDLSGEAPVVVREGKGRVVTLEG